MLILGVKYNVGGLSIFAGRVSFFARTWPGMALCLFFCLCPCTGLLYRCRSVTVHVPGNT